MFLPVLVVCCIPATAAIVAVGVPAIQQPPQRQQVHGQRRS